MYTHKGPNWKAIEAHKIKYRDHTIVVKRDFGDNFHLIDGMPCLWGYVVTDGMSNVMPAAIWFQTVRDAKEAIDILIAVGGEKNAKQFWERWHGRDKYIPIAEAVRAI